MLKRKRVRRRCATNLVRAPQDWRTPALVVVMVAVVAVVAVGATQNRTLVHIVTRFLFVIVFPLNGFSHFYHTKTVAESCWNQRGCI